MDPYQTSTRNFGANKPRRYQFDIVLSEKELFEIIASLCGRDADKELSDFRGILAKRLEQTLWQPFFADVALGRNSVDKRRK